MRPSAKIWVYDQLSLRRTPLGQALSVLRRENSVRLIEYQLRKQKKRQGSTLGVRKRESTVNLFRLFCTFSSLISGWTVLNLNLLYGLQSTLSSRTPISLRERPLNIFMLER